MYASHCTEGTILFWLDGGHQKKRKKIQSSKKINNGQKKHSKSVQTKYIKRAPLGTLLFFMNHYFNIKKEKNHHHGRKMAGDARQ
jgi:hypothetical protein